ncbi:MAG: indole-3-glycerol phosphate synthase TrpC [Armatimonadota bacterium]|nr:indole-3-glycerol phosphate synthase TrpC [Armatimonadota bacterium]MDR5702941.1 indole-3-glycerol phosphate synthase TrpC [Armatimonadota bacterium]
MTILDEIVAHKRREVMEAKEQRPLEMLQEVIAGAPTPRDFPGALMGERIRLIAEIKAASPSGGILRENIDPIALATAYVRGGAAAISVVTEKRYFRGRPEYIPQVKRAGPAPVLLKDFLLDTYQIYEARVLGADAVLLIAAILAPNELAELVAIARGLGMAPLVEVHTEEEVINAVQAGARLIGVNCRDLRTFAVDPQVAARLRPLIPPGVLSVAESGIKTRQDVEWLEALGYHAVLVGTTLVTSADPEAKVRELTGARDL